MSVQNFCSGANKLQRRQVALSEVEVGKARHVPTGRFHTDGAHVEQAHGYGISRSQEGKFLVTEPDDAGNLKVHSSHDNIDDARMAALRRRVQH